MKAEKHVVALLVLMDALGIALSMLLSYDIRITGSFLPYSGPQDLAAYQRMCVLILPVWLLLNAFSGLYAFDLLFEGLGEYSRVVRASSFGVLALTVASFWGRPVLLSRGWILITWLLCTIFLLSGRFLVRKLVRNCRSRGWLTMRTLIVGASAHSITIVHQLKDNPKAGSQIVGLLDEDLPCGTSILGELRVLGPPRDLDYFVQLLNISEVIVVPDAIAWESLHEMIRSSMALRSSRIRVRLLPGVYESLTNSVAMYYKASIPMLTIQEFQIAGSNAAVKKCVDYAVAAVLFVLSVPFMVFAGVAMALSRAPQIIERRVMYGQDGRGFHQFKFHTGVDAEHRRTLDRASLCTDAHSFFGYIGRLLYVTGLDKTPQLWNVLRRDMSLVGSRPLPKPPEKARISMHHLRTAKPGMTGLWALTRDTSVDHELASTLYYVRNWSILLDLQILVLTVRAAFSGQLRPSPLQRSYRDVGIEAASARAAAARG